MARSVGDVLAELFPADVVTVGGAPDGPAGELYPEEAAAVARAAAKRKRDFRAGRLYAREALGRLGFETFPLLSKKNRKPAWPDGVVGSISHAEGCCGVAAAHAGTIVGLGLDIEIADAVTDPVHRHVLTPEEAEWLDGRTARRKWATLIFSAKEAFYKSLAPLRDGFVGFHEVRIEVGEEQRQFAVRPRSEGTTGVLADLRLSGRYRFHQRWVFAGVALRTPGGGRPD